MLTAKQEMFVKEYLIDLNGTQAAIRAGYSEKTANEQASRLLAKVKVRSRVEELQSKRSEKLNLDAEWVLTRLKEISDKCMTAEPVTKWDYEAKAMVETGEYLFDSNGANKSTELIGKHLGMFKDKIEHSGELNIVVGLPDGIDHDND
jgi:phage terminase small subunit